MRVSWLVVWMLGCGGPSEGPPAGPDRGKAAPAAAAAPATIPRPAPRQALPDRFGLGRDAAPAEIAAWDRDVDPSGRALPPGRGTVEQGKALYATACAACHGVEGEGGLGPRLIGPEPKTGFGEDPTIPHTIGNWWPYATTIFDYTRRAMPQTAPGSLTDDQVYGLVAFLLARNGAVPEDFVADRESVTAVKMPTTVKFVPDDREVTPEFR